MQARPYRAVTEATFARTFNPVVRLLQECNQEALHPHPEQQNEWATGRLRRTHPAETGAFLAAFETAVRFGRRVTTAIRASVRRGPEVAVAAGAAVADADVRRKEKPWQD